MILAGQGPALRGDSSNVLLGIAVLLSDFLIYGAVLSLIQSWVLSMSPVVALQEPKASTDRTVWDGVYTEKEATRGRTLYMDACASCHGDDLRGRSTAPSLVEESFSFLWDDATVGELLDRIRRLMPSDRPNSLPAQSYRDIVAFILQSNKFPAGETELDADTVKLRQILITSKRREAK